MKFKKDFVVGSYESQNRWKDYDDYLMKGVGKSYKNKLALDFGCGPGRNSIKYHDLFRRIDGVDISEELIKKAKENFKFHKVSLPKLFVNNGYDLSGIEDNTYDFVMSTIAMQHICVYSTRFNLLKEFYRILKKGGKISIQMGYGKDSPQSVGYYEDYYNSIRTNRGCDTRIESPAQVRKDLVKIGFKDFEYDIRPTGPGDIHPNWIFFWAKK